MGADKTVKPLVPLAIQAIAELLEMPPERVPVGVELILLRFGRSCYTVGRDDALKRAGHRNKTPTVPSFPPPPAVPTIELQPSERPTKPAPPPKGTWKKQ